MTPMDRRREMDELAGIAPKRGRGRPRKVLTTVVKKVLPAPLPKVEDPELSGDDDPDMSYRAVYGIRQGVPIRWLALVFGLTEHNVKRRLQEIRPTGVGAHGNPLYVVSEAAPYLVDPKTNIGEFLRGIKDDDLPDDLRLKLWNARRARNRVLQEEGELWHSSKVIEKFSEVLLAIREKLQLIPDRVERMSGVTPEQYKLIRAVVDGVQDDMHKTILDMAEGTDIAPIGNENDEEIVL